MVRSVLRIEKETKFCRQTATKVVQTFRQEELTFTQKPGGKGRLEGFHSLKTVSELEKHSNMGNCLEK